MPLTTADIGIQLLMYSTVNLQEIEARLTARVFAAVHQPERGPAMRASAPPGCSTPAGPPPALCPSSPHQ
ncbi:MAG: hypothetical protein ACK55E_02755 [Cyanobacteriota bacterium]|jgi:hypothetical protein